MSCAACERPDLNALNAELQEGKRSMAALSEFYEVPEGVLIRHKYEHMTAVVLKTQTDPVSTVQALVNFKMELEGRMGLGPVPFLRAGNEKVSDAVLAKFGGMYLQTLSKIADLTGAKIRPDWRDALPQWNQMLKVLMDFASELPPAQRDKLYLTLEEVDKIGSESQHRNGKK